VVVVDDGSTDATREVLRAFEARLPLRASSQRAAGLASARNHGVFLSRGAVILFLDEDPAEPDLLERHLAAHVRFPEFRFAVLGRARLDPALAGDPLMSYVTEIGRHAWAEPNAGAGERLDWRHFHAGRSSCKRAFLLYRGIFGAAFAAGGEDVELAWRLARFGFETVWEPAAVTWLTERIGFDDFCGRMYVSGRWRLLLDRLHDAPEVHVYTGASAAPHAWRALAPVHAPLLRTARALDRLVRLEGASARGDELLPLVHRSYRAAFRASELKGMVDMASELAGTPPRVATVPAR
jgi:glycosyltransferase involved in cell wall biosynthesis